LRDHPFFFPRTIQHGFFFTVLLFMNTMYTVYFPRHGPGRAFFFPSQAVYNSPPLFYFHNVGILFLSGPSSSAREEFLLFFFWSCCLSVLLPAPVVEIFGEGISFWGSRFLSFFLNTPSSLSYWVKSSSFSPFGWHFTSSGKSRFFFFRIFPLCRHPLSAGMVLHPPPVEGALRKGQSICWKVYVHL